MKRTELVEKTDRQKTKTRDALQTVFDALNQGQKKKILKNEAVHNLFIFYNVDFGGDN